MYGPFQHNYCVSIAKLSPRKNTNFLSPNQLFELKYFDKIVRTEKKDLFGIFYRKKKSQVKEGHKKSL